MPSIESARLLDWVTELISAWGYRPDDANYLARSLIDANERGVDSHGVLRLAAYAKRIEAGLVDPAAVPHVSISGAAITVEARGATGQIAARAASVAAADVARELGVASAVVRGSAHFGTAGFYARELSSKGMVAIVASNSEPIVVPHGGREALLGTNPLAFSAPTYGAPLSLDMATSTSAMGKVLLARTRDERVPETWGVDNEGRPASDPHRVHALLPMGGPKGYGLGMLVEILAGVLSGSAIAHGLGNMYTDFSRPQDIGHYVLALDVEHYMPLETFRDRMQQLIDAAHATPPAQHDRPVLLPGEPEERVRAERRTSGVPLPDSTVAELAALGVQYSTPFPAVMS